MTQDFTLAKLGILHEGTYNLLKINICNFLQTTANLSYDQKCSSFGDYKIISHDLQLLSLVQRLRYIH